MPRLWGLPLVESVAMPTGTALIADFAQTKLFVRDGGRLGVDTSGDLFGKNQVRLLYEGRFAFGCLRPAAVIEVDLTAG